MTLTNEDPMVRAARLAPQFRRPRADDHAAWARVREHESRTTHPLSVAPGCAVLLRSGWRDGPAPVERDELVSHEHMPALTQSSVLIVVPASECSLRLGPEDATHVVVRSVISPRGILTEGAYVSAASFARPARPAQPARPAENFVSHDGSVWSRPGTLDTPALEATDGTRELLALERRGIIRPMSDEEWRARHGDKRRPR